MASTRPSPYARTKYPLFLTPNQTTFRLVDELCLLVYAPSLHRCICRLHARSSVFVFFFFYFPTVYSLRPAIHTLQHYTASDRVQLCFIVVHHRHRRRDLISRVYPLILTPACVLFACLFLHNFFYCLEIRVLIVELLFSLFFEY